MDIFVSQLFAGLSVGSILLLIALGLTFTFGQMNVINMAHGELIMAGAYTTYVMQGGASQAGLQPGPALLVALPVAFLIAGLIGLLLERVLIRRLYGRPLDTLLATWGVSLVLQQLARDIFGAPNVQVRSPGWLDGGLQLGGMTLPHARLFIMALVVVAVAAIWVFLTRLPHGRRMRSVMQNRQLASASGVHTARVDALTFFIGSGLAGIAGVALTLLGSVGPTLGVNYIIDAFLVVIVGGLGQLRGAVLAALALGIINAFVEFGTQASLAKVVVFLAIVAFLQLRPQGMFVMRSRALTGVWQWPASSGPGGRAPSSSLRSRWSSWWLPPRSSATSGSTCSPSTSASPPSRSASAWRGDREECSPSGKASSSGSAATPWRCTSSCRRLGRATCRTSCHGAG